jgi:simple sugar transport system permease protein
VIQALRRGAGATVGALSTLLAVVVALALFAVFLELRGTSSVDALRLMGQGAFGSTFALANTLQRAAPLMLTALCVLLPARAGLIVIGGEGALALGGLAAAGLAIAAPGLPAPIAWPLMALAAMLAGGLWIGAAGWLRQKRGGNATIGSLLLAYLGIAVMNHLVEGPLRDPDSLNKPSTAPLPEALRVGDLPGLSVHWGLVFGILACVLSWVLVERTTWGFAARIAGGNVRAAQVQGLPVGKLILGFAALGGAFAGLAGFFEVAAVHGSANASLAAGYGYTGILIAFLARHNALAIIPVAILLAGFDASSGLVQRRMDLPDATMQVLQGIVFMAILMSDAAYGRLPVFKAKG